MSARLSRGLVFVGLCLLAVSTVYPLIFMALNSMRTASQFRLNPNGLPKSYNLDNFRELFAAVPFISSLLHSLIVVIPAVVLATFSSALAAFVFTKTPIRLGNLLFWLMLTIMFMPGIVVLVPLYVQIAHAGLANTFLPVILIYTALNIPFGTYLLRSNFRGIPDSVIEAARVDGGSWMRIFTKVVLPMGKPGILTVGILTFLNVWNDLFVSLVLLHTPDSEMLTPTLAQLSGKYATDVPVLMAGLLIGAVPTLLVYFFSSRLIIGGMMAGAVR